MERREFIRTVGAAGGAAALAGANSAHAAPAETTPDLPLGPVPEVVRNGMRYRKLGTTGVEVSAIGLGGHHIGRQKEERDSIALMRAAIDAGITFMDNCWDYHDGVSETRMGKALKDGYREKVFLMTKIDGRTQVEAERQIDESLKRLQTDHIDLLQHHEIIRLDDPDRVFARSGAHKAVVAAQKAGKVRFIGFTGHKDPLVHLRMLEVAAEKGVHFDAAQLPLNVLDAHFRSFARRVVPELVKQGVGVLGMKAMGDGLVLKSKTATATECLHYALSLPTSVVITGIDTKEILTQALDAVRTFEPLSPAKAAALLARTREAAITGDYELFKTSPQFDSTAKHPEWLG